MTIYRILFFFVLFLEVSYCSGQSIGGINGCGSNWLYNSNQNSGVKIGDLDIAGDQITVEAIIDRTSNYSGGRLYAGDIVSKHNVPSDVNYLLRPNSAEITTTNGYFITPPICDISLNKTYHVAMVYDGKQLKFYRNGFLMSQVNCTGNLFQNNYNTTIGEDANYPATLQETFIGYINEVRIWNVARTQSQIGTYMNVILPNPSLQSGLLAYYNFDDLKNKQGNTAWNGTMFGSATLQNSNASCSSYVADSCDLVQNVCGNNWLQIQDQYSGLRIGDLDVPGDQITVEAMFDRVAVSKLLDSVVNGKGEIVSKHTDPVNANYLLRADRAQLTTTNGHFIAAGDCGLPLNKTYHIAMVYNGKELKYYRNGFLLKAIPCTGNMVTNDLKTTIGNFAYNPGEYNNTTIGYINEVRIWNVARSQTELRTYLDKSLPAPSTQMGLLAYYTFDNLKNKQGNSSYDGVLFGNATIRNANPVCESYIADSCVVFYKAVLSKSKDTSICFGQSAQMYASVTNALDYSWSPVTGLSNPTISNPVASPKNSTVFYITAHSNGSGLVETLFDSIKISVLPLPQINVTKDNAICLNNTLQLSASGAITYSWYPTSGLSNSTIANPLASPIKDILYFVTGTDNVGCYSKDSVLINVMPLPAIVKSNDTAICIGGTAKLIVSGGNSYQWIPTNGLSDAFISNPVASPDATTRYTVKVTNGANNCTALDSILINVIPKPVFALNPQSYNLCMGDTVTLTASGGDNYEWLVYSGISNIYSPVTVVKPGISTTYPIKIFHKICNIMDTLQTTVIVNPIPTVSIFKSGDIECSIGYSWLIASGGAHYKWSPVDGLSNPLIPNPKVQITQNTKYTVTVTSSNGCNATDTVTVNFLNHSGKMYLMPDAFTPNGDGLNDNFGIKKWGLITELQFSIYDRWGNRVFFTTDPSKCWDGYSKSYAQPAGVFVYYIKAKTLCGDVEKKGTVVLIR